MGTSIIRIKSSESHDGQSYDVPDISIPKDANGKEVENVQLIICGDPAVGKTSLCDKYLTGMTNDQYLPTAINIFKGYKDIKVNGRIKKIFVSIYDVNGDLTDRKFSSLRPQWYRKGDLFIICASKNNFSSFESIDGWMAEIDSANNETPKVLVRTKCDIPDESN